MSAPRKGLVGRFFDAGGGALVLVIFGVIVIGMGANELRLSKASVASTCTVLETSTRQGKRTNDIVPQVRLAHEVGGKRYERLDEGEQRSPEDAKTALAPFEKGRSVPCHYIEGHPELIVVFRDRNAEFVLGAGIALVVIAVGAYFASRKPRAA